MKPYYREGEITIHHGDAMDLITQAGIFGAVVTDPPFTAAGGSTNGRSSELDGQFFRHWFSGIAERMRRVIRPEGCAFVCCDWRTLGDVCRAWREVGERMSSSARDWEVSQALVWDRGGIGMGSPFRNSFEMIAFARGPEFNAEGWPRNLATVIREPWPYGKHEHHGSEKPVPLLRRFVALTDGPVLDPFCGSGTTLVAAKELGRTAVGIEIEERYCEIAAKRLAQKVLFTEAGA